MTTRVLVVDDDHRYRLLVSLALEGSAFEVVGEAHDLDEGVGRAEDLRPDVVLVDLHLPAPETGPLQALGAAAPGALLVAVSSLSGLGPSAVGGDARAAVLPKGVRPAELADRLERLLAERVPDDDGRPARSLRLPPEPSSARAARRFATEVLGGWACDEDAVDTVLLLLSEVVSNAVLHARTELEVGITPRPGVVRLEVVDGAPGPIRRRASGPDDQGGRGTALVEALAVAWGTDRLTTGKRVWFEVACDGLRGHPGGP